MASQGTETQGVDLLCLQLHQNESVSTNNSKSEMYVTSIEQLSSIQAFRKLVSFSLPKRNHCL